MFQVMEDLAMILPILYHLDQYHRCDEMLLWLIKNNLTGQKFLDWFKFECHSSFLSMSKNILSRVEKNEKSVILYQRDMI